MDAPPVDGCPDTYLVDNELFGTPKMLATYLLDAADPAILDAGTVAGAERILDAMDTVGIDPAAVETILVSHVHLDHAAGTARLLAACENATVVVHERGVPYLTDADKLDRLVESVEAAIGMKAPYGDPELVPADRCRAVSGGEVLDLGDRELELYDAPGHAPHHYVALEPSSGTLFGADAVGAFDPRSETVAPTTPPPSFDLEANLDTVDRLLDLAPSRTLYSHFGPGQPGEATAELHDYAEILPAFVDTVERVRAETDDDLDAMLDELRPEWESPTLRRDVVGVCRYLDES
ncbi:Glyoxylase, beta-lactamase superfamily II [Halorientalis persicus]|uniref:Glyoxylase, beta-lactamase superfamily II n=1 Tax=Halorientalis persicus TaxID=1367881 RepID=A0A1H8D027_9EURY|nr:MBL fold metallo-hydrolase [Halorientalis persicus]SEM99938.1 Glyoxylase, beta-lactamase superfamily II [Halorientalis persicus]